MGWRTEGKNVPQRTNRRANTERSRDIFEGSRIDLTGTVEEEPWPSGRNLGNLFRSMN